MSRQPVFFQPRLIIAWFLVVASTVSRILRFSPWLRVPLSDLRRLKTLNLFLDLISRIEYGIEKKELQLNFSQRHR